MSRILPIDDGDGQMVRRPRATDAIGMALRNTYGQPPAVPQDMLVILTRLDANPPTPR